MKHPIALALIVALASVVSSASQSGPGDVPLPHPKPTAIATRDVPAAAQSKLVPAAPVSPDLTDLRHALELVHHGKADQAGAIVPSIRDPVARKLVEWAILRSESTEAGFDRYAAFLSANPDWPSRGMLQRRAEMALLQEGSSPAAVRAFFDSTPPVTPQGRLALANALEALGDRAGARFHLRHAWRSDAMPEELEAQFLDAHHDLLTRDDYVARMDERFSAGDIAGGMRTAQRLGDVAVAIGRARAAVITRADNAGQLLDAVPQEGRNDPGYIFSRTQWLRRNDRIPEAARLLLSTPRDASVLHNLDEWWVERRIVCRKLLDLGDAETAYRIASEAVPPPRENYRGEQQFTAGWIALRFLDDPRLALTHFARIADGIVHPITLARSEYWQGRALEAAHRLGEARPHYEAAGRFPIAYYGQIARARLGLPEIALRRPPQPTPAHRDALNRLDLLRAAELLYAADARHLLLVFVADLAERMRDVHALEALAEIASRHDDARAMLLIGKGALTRGFAFDAYAFPTAGIPHFTAIGPEVDRSVIYSIVRQESAFDQTDVSSANAMGLMQVTPEAGRHVAQRFHVRYDRKRLLSDAVYNTQIGAGEIGELLQIYRGSYILAFAAYNAGQGRVREWIERYGDPRDPQVDPIDWVERIPFSETRNYVQRVLENLQVYRVRLGRGSRLMIEADLHRGATAN
jgi:peptidoglycan lytic transglycosylase